MFVGDSLKEEHCVVGSLRSEVLLELLVLVVLHG